MRAALPLLMLALLAGCASDPAASPTDPGDGTRPDLTSQAFRINLDLTGGRLDVAAPSMASASAARPGGVPLAHSLIGDEGVQVFARNLSCAPIPKDRERKRCSFDLSLANRFDYTDLLTPTTFPKPPAGVEGVLLLPWSATATGATGPVTPSPDWDHAPVNFFNDFGSCPGGAKSDCLRYETAPSPFYARTGTPARRVGFDVPVAATGVTAYVVVAADVRENAPRTFFAPFDHLRSGVVTSQGSVFTGLRSSYWLGAVQSDETIWRSFFSFSAPPAGRVIEFARLHIHLERRFEGDPVGELLDYGATLDAEDYGLPPADEYLEFHNIGGSHYVAAVTDQVKAAYAAGARDLQFRLRVRHEEDTYFIVDGQFEREPVLELVTTLE